MAEKFISRQTIEITFQKMLNPLTYEQMILKFQLKRKKIPLRVQKIEKDISVDVNNLIKIIHSF